MIQRTINIFIPTILIFLVVNLLLYVFKTFLTDHNFDRGFLFVANCIIFSLSITSLIIQHTAMTSPNSQAFIRGIYSSLLIKFFACITAVTIYILNLKGAVNQPGLFSSMALYILYTAFEVKGLMKASRKKNA